MKSVAHKLNIDLIKIYGSTASVKYFIQDIWILLFVHSIRCWFVNDIRHINKEGEINTYSSSTRTILKFDIQLINTTYNCDVHILKVTSFTVDEGLGIIKGFCCLYCSQTFFYCKKVHYEQMPDITYTIKMLFHDFFTKLKHFL